MIRALSGAERATLPPLPASLVTILAPPPPRAPLDARFAAVHRMGCKPGDLRVRSGQLVLLSGTHHYGHVCIDAGGHIMAYPHLTLNARTIAVAPGAIIEADGDGPSEQRASVTGRYAAAGACRADRTPPHAGVPGPASAYGDMVAYGGGGGGMIVLNAQAVLLAGTLSSDGSAGANGADVTTGYGGTFPAYVTGGGGGSGGGVLIAAHDVQLNGRISAVGGSGGPGESSEQAAGMHGGPGCIKLFTDSLQVRSGSLPFAGPAVIGRL